MMRKLFLICGFPVLYFGAILSVFADTVAPPCTYETFSEDEKYVFVMIAPDERVDCITGNDETKIEAKKIRSQFSISGLYNNDDSTEPLWTVDWYSYKVYVSADGKHLVRTGPWASNETDEAFSFFNEGKLLKTYKVNDLVRYIFSLPHSVSHFRWEKETNFNVRKNILEVITLENGKFSFNLENGEIISAQKPLIPSFENSDSALKQILMLLGGICVVVIIVLALVLRKKLFAKH